MPVFAAICPERDAGQRIRISPLAFDAERQHAWPELTENVGKRHIGTEVSMSAPAGFSGSPLFHTPSGVGASQQASFASAPSSSHP